MFRITKKSIASRQWVWGRRLKCTWSFSRPAFLTRFLNASMFSNGPILSATTNILLKKKWNYHLKETKNDMHWMYISLMWLFSLLYIIAPFCLILNCSVFSWYICVFVISEIITDQDLCNRIGFGEPSFINRALSGHMKPDNYNDLWKHPAMESFNNSFMIIVIILLLFW